MTRKIISEMNTKEIYNHLNKMTDLSYNIYEEVCFHVEELKSLTMKLKNMYTYYDAHKEDNNMRHEMFLTYQQLMCCIYSLSSLLALPLLVPYHDSYKTFCEALEAISTLYLEDYENGSIEYSKLHAKLIKFPFINLDDIDEFKEPLKEATKIFESFIKIDKK